MHFQNVKNNKYNNLFPAFFAFFLKESFPEFRYKLGLVYVGSIHSDFYDEIVFVVDFFLLSIFPLEVKFEVFFPLFSLIEKLLHIPL